MANFNLVVIAGNLTRDVELRYTPKGAAIAKLSMAINRQWKSESGEQKEEVCFVEVDAFGRQAETLGQYCKKGSPLLVNGRLRLDVWDDKTTGQKRSKLGVVLEGFQFLGTGKGESSPAPRKEKPSEASGDFKAKEPADADQPPEEDDVPF